MIIIVVTVITQGFRVPPEARGEIKSHLIYNTGFFQAVGVISFGEFQLFLLVVWRLLTTHSICLSYVNLRYRALLMLISIDHNSLLIYGSLKKPTLDRFTRVTHFSTGVSLIMCLAMGITGFFTFGSKTQGNVLNNFPSDNIVVNIARLYDCHIDFDHESLANLH